jgi:hypothetical protein
MNADSEAAAKGRLVAFQTDSQDPVDALNGMLDLPARPDALLDELRGPAPGGGHLASQQPRTPD